MLSRLLLFADGFWLALLLTLVIEVPAYLAAFAGLGWLRAPSRSTRPLSGRGAVGLVLAVNLVTHPLLWTAAPHLSGAGTLLLCELGVVAVEATAAYAAVRREPGWALIAAAGANALSVLLGWLLLPLLTAAAGGS